MTDNNDNDLIAQRRNQLKALREKGNAYPNNFRRDVLATDLHAHYSGKDHDALEDQPVRVKVAGRMMTRRVMGKASFAHLQDMSGQIQLYVKGDNLPNDRYAEFKSWDLGDILGAEGTLFKTKTGELSIMVNDIHLLTKSLRPLPEKFHGLTDHELRYRQRYLDLITNEETRRTFAIRSSVIDFLRRYLKDSGFVEVETPMMHVIPGGATARPFITHHNSLDMDLYLRVAPELFLKRLVIGGIEKVFEINRSFRNEGLSPRHNPEFTMLEFYQAYADYQDMMKLTEAMMRSLVKEILGDPRIRYQGETYDLARPFTRMTVKQAVLHFNKDIRLEDLESREPLHKAADKLGIPVQDIHGPGKILIEIFEKTVEQQLKEPTFITGFPTEVSPLARRSNNDPSETERFELFIGGREIANGFSELNDPEDQAKRFLEQLEGKEAGDEEAMHYDEDYITALEYGMPPTAGEGIGIDRLVVLLTDSASIRDVILFPHMRPK
ncbi:MAG: lysyl-tRNA synthetase [Gammaproteobacteria bacterium]|nr:lysyl-tRNA synthetase [Gammaproteobacteria bacterium]